MEDDSNGTTRTISVDGREVSVATLLERWLRAPRPAPAGQEPAAIDRLRAIFVRGGLEALAHATRCAGWVQLGLRPGDEALRGRMYASVAAVARSLLHDGRVRNVFFMHKEPGLRLRFELGRDDRAAVTEAVRAALEPAVREGSISAISPGIYEPEARLFGGPRSMEHVHRLFTPDSLMWLEFHSLAHAEPSLSGSAWALSFVVLQALLASLRIVDWEDIDVWDRVRTRTGRRLPPGAAGLAAFDGLADELRAAWVDHARPYAELPAPLVELGRAAARAIGDEAVLWRERYFASEGACLGARAGAALFVIFHWNRAGLSPMRQALLAESLAGRTTV